MKRTKRMTKRKALEILIIAAGQHSMGTGVEIRSVSDAEREDVHKREDGNFKIRRKNG
jgi:hypothetical protein